MKEYQKAAHFETWEHIHEVRKLLHKMQTALGQRAIDHDQSKIYSEEECDLYAKYTPQLKNIEYASPEYYSNLERMRSAIDHHQKSNSHHPEYYDQGIDGMNLLDIVEMFCDYKAATMRSKDGDIRESIEHAKAHKGMSEQLANIFLNTIQLIEEQ